MVLRKVGLVVAIPLALIATLSGANQGPTPTLREKSPERRLYRPLSLVALEAGFGEALMAQAAEREAEAARLEAERLAAERLARLPVNRRPHSDAWWRGVATCEQGGRNDPFFGYFSVMDGSTGGLSWAEQVAIANGIISRYGDGAWAASCVAAGYRASPGG